MGGRGEASNFYIVMAVEFREGFGQIDEQPDQETARHVLTKLF